MKIREDVGLSFDDVLLVPKKSDIVSRKDVDISMELCPGITLQTPIISANMDTVTEYNMAIEMARLGGLGIIHRFMSIEEQVAQVKKVKNYESAVIHDPYTILYDMESTIGQLKKEMVHGSAVIVDNVRKLKGIITKRDLLFSNDDEKVCRVMTPFDRMSYMYLDEYTVDLAIKIFKKDKVEKIPIIRDNLEFYGLITIADIKKKHNYPKATRDSNGRLMVGAAVGVKEEDYQRVIKLLEANCDIICIDIAHGHHQMVIDFLDKIYMLAYKYNFKIIAGNVATIDGAFELSSTGASIVKAGVGGGASCSTRIVAGSGVPQVTVIDECVNRFHEKNSALKDKHKIDPISIIADGGIRNSGDFAKAMALGAKAVMIGSLFSGTYESPGKLIKRDGHRYKAFRGMASSGAANSRPGAKESDDEVVPEGVETTVPLSGHVKDVVYNLIGGLKSAMSYSGAKNLHEFKENAEFIRITPASLQESKPHILRN